MGVTKKKSTVWKKILYVICFFLLLYCTGALYIGLRIEGLIVGANEVPPVENPSPEVISDEYFKRLGYKNGHTTRWYDDPDAWEISLRTPVFTLYDFSGAKSVYVYTYFGFNNDGLRSASIGIPVWITSVFQDGKWRITDVYEPA